MRGKYYYLVASLPYLKFGEAPPVSGGQFIAECEKWLSPEDMKTVLSADVKLYEVRDGDTDILIGWKGFDMELRTALALVRTGGKDADKKKAETAKSIMEKETPLLKERAFEKIRWDFLDEKSAMCFFDVGWLALYFLKLQILERLAVFNKDKGERFFYDTCEVKIWEDEQEK